MTDTGMGRRYSVLLSNLGVVTQVWCSKGRKTRGDSSAFEPSHPQTQRSKPGVRLQTVAPAQGTGRVQVLGK